MKEIMIGAIAYIFALLYNLILFMLNIKCADDKFVNAATFLMAVNTLKDMTIFTVVLYNIFLG